MANKTRVQVRGTIGKSVRLPQATATVSTGLQPVKGLAGSYQNASFTLDINGQIIKVFNGTSGGGGGSLSVSDGTTTLTGITSLVFAGAVVTGTSPNATITVTGGGGGASPYNIDPSIHVAGVPTFPANDEAEGSSLDTAGTRFTGATAWAWVNQGACVLTVGPQGSFIFSIAADGLPHAIVQTAPATPYTMEAKVRIYNTAGGGTGIGLFPYNSGSGKNYNFIADDSGGPFACYAFNTPSSFNSVLFNSVNYTGFAANLLGEWQWLRVSNDGTTLRFLVSYSGYEGTFQQLGSATLASFIGSVDKIGLCFNNNVAAGIAIVDHFRQVA